MNEDIIEEVYPALTEKEYGYRVSIIKDQYITTLRITNNEYDRLLARSVKEFKAIPSTFWNRLKFAWSILWAKTEKGDL